MLTETGKIRTVSRIASYLQEHVKKYSPGEKIGTEVGLSRVLGASRETVRRAVEKLMEEGLIERKVGRGLYVAGGAKQLKLVEFLVPAIADHWYAPAIISAQASLKSQGIDMLIRNGNVNLNYELNLVYDLPNSAADAAIIVSVGDKSFSESLIKLEFSNYPFVVLDEEFPDYHNINWIAADFYKMGYSAAQTLVKLGHKKIACIGDLQRGHGLSLIRGIVDAVNDAGFACDRSLFVDVPAQSYLVDDKDKYVSELKNLMQRANRPTAFVLPRENYAWRFCVELQKMGFKIPRDVSIIGSGHDKEDFRCPIKISSFVVDSAKMGEIAVEMLLAQAKLGAAAKSKGILLETKFVDGQSIAPAPEI